MTERSVRCAVLPDGFNEAFHAIFVRNAITYRYGCLRAYVRYS
jgi:hypothetical protein